MFVAQKIYTDGFSLAELLAALAIAGILTSLAISSFSWLTAELRISSNVNNLVHILHLARQTSWNTGEDVVLCKSATGAQCQDGQDWDSGWMLFSNLDSDDPPRADPGEPVHRTSGPLANLAIRTNRRAFIMRPAGRRTTNGTLIYCDRGNSAGARAVIVSYTGKARISREHANGDTINCTALTR